MDLGALAKAAAGAGDLGRATAVVHSITNADHKAWTLVDLVKGAEPGQACSLLAWALTVDKWQSLVEVLVNVDPRAVIAIADEYLGATP